jgi:hypothetical protein
MHYEIEHGSVQHGAGIRTFSCDGRADYGENAGADDRADAEGRQRQRPKGFLQAMRRVFRVANQLVNRFGGEDLMRQGTGS